MYIYWGLWVSLDIRLRESIGYKCAHLRIWLFKLQENPYKYVATYKATGLVANRTFFRILGILKYLVQPFLLVTDMMQQEKLYNTDLYKKHFFIRWVHNQKLQENLISDFLVVFLYYKIVVQSCRMQPRQPVQDVCTHTLV